MFKADNARVFQEANQAIVEIRKSEIDYYIRVAAGLGTQAALIGGFSYLTFSQNLEKNYVYTYYVNIVYYVAAALTIGFAIHVILTTMMLQILGPGLALNGPVGSMARCVDGMRIEQRQILGGFSLMMVFFAMSTQLLFWVTMDKISALFSSMAFVICARYWFFYCGRMYRRFYWETKHGSSAGQWREISVDDEPTIPLSLAINAQKDLNHSDNSGTTVNPLNDIEQGVAVTSRATGSLNKEHRPTMFERMSFVGGTGKVSLIDRVSFALMPGSLKKSDANLEREIEARSSMMQDVRYSSLHHRPSMSAGFVIPPGAVTVNPKDIACQGFIVMNVAPKGLIKQKSTWDRRFVVLNFRGQLFYYKSRTEFKENPHSHMNPRPLSLDDFYITTERFPEVESIPSNASTNSEKFWFTLIPKDDDRYRNWQYRTDTEEELDMWLTAMKQVSPSSFKQFL